MRERRGGKGEERTGRGVRLEFEEQKVKEKEEEWVRGRGEGESSGALLRSMSVNCAFGILTFRGFWGF